MKIIKRIAFYIGLLCRKHFFGFIKGNDYLTNFHLKKMHSLIQAPDPFWQSKYENKLSLSLGGGKVITYAAARMAFYSILKALDLKKDEEVIVTGFTCSVMVNAIIRIGAIPVFSDIDPETFGSSPLEISKLISPKTRVIVAQHSFGIPCEIDKIQELAKTRNIFLIEDCALSYLSKYKGITLGNWGDAAIFSSDHSKPLSTLIGGFAYTNSDQLYEKLKTAHELIGEIPQKQQYNIYKQLIFESKYYKPEKYRFLKLFQLFDGIYNKIIRSSNTPTFLIDDSASETGKDIHYPYPSKFPAFLSYLGLLELEEYKKSIQKRKLLLNQLIYAISIKQRIPACYTNEDNYIIPLRFAFCSDSKIFHFNISKFIDKEWFWFKKPIEATSEDVTAYGYILGSCPVSEDVGRTIINVPCIHYEDNSMINYINRL